MSALVALGVPHACQGLELANGASSACFRRGNFMSSNGDVKTSSARCVHKAFLHALGRGVFADGAVTAFRVLLVVGVFTSGAQITLSSSHALLEFASSTLNTAGATSEILVLTTHARNARRAASVARESAGFASVALACSALGKCAGTTGGARSITVEAEFTSNTGVACVERNLVLELASLAVITRLSATPLLEFALRAADTRRAGGSVELTARAAGAGRASYDCVLAAGTQGALGSTERACKFTRLAVTACGRAVGTTELALWANSACRLGSARLVLASGTVKALRGVVSRARGRLVSPSSTLGALALDKDVSSAALSVALLRLLQRGAD